MVYDAVIRSKLLYGLESEHLTEGQIRKLSTFQLKALRHILGITTRYVDRTHTNQYVMQTAWRVSVPGERAGREANGEGVQEERRREGCGCREFGQYYRESKGRYLRHLLRAGDFDPERFVVFDKGVPRPKLNPIRRVGRPRGSWAVGALTEMWEAERAGLGEDDVAFAFSNVPQLQALYLIAHCR